MATWKKILTSGSAIVVDTIKNPSSTIAGTQLTGSFTGSFTGDGSGLTGTGFNIDELSNTLTTLAEGDLLVAADVDDSNEEKKITFANLRNDMFSDISGDATVAAGGALTIASNAVENSMIAVGTIASASIAADAIDANHLADDSVKAAALNSDVAGSGLEQHSDGTIRISTGAAGAGLSGGGGSALAVGVDDSSIEISSDALRVKALGVTNGMLAGSIANAKLSNSSVTVGTTAIALGASSTTLAGMTGIDFAAGNATIGASIGANSLTLGGSGTTVVVDGNLTVNGTTTTVATTNTVVEDQLMFLATGSKDSNKDAGIVVQHGSTDLQGRALYHDTDSSRWSVGESVAHNASSIEPNQFVATVKTQTVNPDTTSGSYGAGEMHVNTSTGDIWIRYG